MIIITGIGRTGTSALTGYCKALGMNIGNAQWIEIYDAGNEDINTIHINQAIFFHDKDMTREIQGLRRDVVKDPYFLRSTKCIRQWWKARQDLTIVWCRRNPKDIVDSMRRKPDMDGPAYRCFEDLIIQKEKEWEACLKELKIPYHEITYPFKFEDAYKIFKGNKRVWDRVIRS